MARKPRRSPAPTKKAASSTPPPPAAPENLNPFEFAQRQFERAADHLGLDPGMREILRSPKRQLIVSIPVRMDNKTDQGLHGIPRAALDRARAVQGRHPLPSGRDARRGQGAGDVDDLEVRGRQHSLRRRQGRDHGRPQEALARRERAAHAPLHVRDRHRPRPRPRHSGARRLHDPAAHGVDHGHLLDDAGLFHPRRRHGQADPARRLGGAQRRDRRGLLRRDRRGRQADAPAAEGGDGRRPGLRQRRGCTPPASSRKPA